MSELCVGKIDVTKISKDDLFKGAKGIYLDIVLIPTPNSDRGDDWMIVQGISKEKKEAGGRGPIIGNAKKIRKSGSKPQSSIPEPKEEEKPDDLPF